MLRLAVLSTVWMVAALKVAAVAEVRDGSFERGGVGWVLSGGAKVVPCENAPHGKKVLQCTESADSAIQIVVAQPSSQYSVGVWVRTENVKPVSGTGYAYAAVYEFDSYGNLIAFRDFVQLRGTNEWRKFSATWTTHPKALYFEVRLGLFNANGIALFDAVQVGRGHEAPERYSEPSFVKGSVALVLHEPSFPQNPAAPSPQVLANWLKQAGYEPQVVTAKELTDENWVDANRERIGLLVLPNSPYFPMEAHRNLLRLLTSGVDLLTFGGYAFDVPMQRTDSGYIPIKTDKPLKVELLNPNPGFETVNADGSADGWELSSPRQCFVASQNAKFGSRCAAVKVPDELGACSAGWRASINVRSGDRLRISGWVKTKNVKGLGYAFLAYYPFSGDRWVNPRDIAQVRGDTDWQHFSATFTVPYGVDRVEIRFGIYNATGEAFFDDVRLERVELPPRINTRYGEPRDGLEISPLQIGMFDAHHVLRNAMRLGSEGWSWAAERGQITGYSAVGVLRQSARWKPIVLAYDRFGRKVGTAGAVMHHYAGTFAGGTWVFFGVDNFDLTKLPKFCERVLFPTLKRLRRGVFICDLKSRFACYRPGEPIEVALRIGNLVITP